MPNQLNYRTILGTSVPLRPQRITAEDAQNIIVGQQQILFGTTSKDVLEMWVYNPDDTFAGHINVFPSDPALSLKTVLDESGTYQMLNVDLIELFDRLTLPAGRYAVVTNFFRNEVGSEEGTKLFVSEVAEDRTLVKFKLVDVNESTLKELYEFVTPSVPRLYAQGLIDQIFDKAVNVPPDKKIQSSVILSKMVQMVPSILQRLNVSNTVPQLNALINQILEMTYVKSVDKLIADNTNYYIQQDELMNYIITSVDESIQELQNSGAIDPRFTLV